VSVDGAEEDGVDNRVEAPTWAPDGGSDSTAEGQKSDGESVAIPDTEETESVTTAGDHPEPPASPAFSGPASPAAAEDPAARANGAAQPASNGGSQYGHGSTQPAPASLMAPGAASSGLATTPLASAAGAARGLAAKVSAPFSVLSKPKARPKTPPKVKKPAGGAPRPQGGVRPQARLTPGQMTGPQTRRAQLRLDRIEPWSVMKFSFLISLIGWVVLLIAVSLLYFTLSKLGVFTSIEHTVGLVTTSKSKPGSNAASWFKASRVLGYTMLVGAVNVILLTALATIGAVLYNLVTMLAGGVEVTLKESD
jgi:Transmembrane domain of unknown function (DUF3566)